MTDQTVAEMLIFGTALLAIMLGLIILVATRAPRPAPQLPPPVTIVPQPVLTPQEAAAVRHVQATGVPVDFVQPHPQTGQPVIFRAAPSPDGRTFISIVQPQA